MSVVDPRTGETINLNKVYAELLHIVQRCGRIIRDAFYKEKTFSTKESFADFVTETDTRVEKTLIEAIKEKYPDHYFIGEESTVDKVDFNENPVWIIDPVDGTTNFVHRFPYCALSIAFYVNKEAQIGVVFNPIRDELFSAIKGQGAYCNGRTIAPTNQKELNRAQIITEFGSGREAEHLNMKAKNMRNLIERVHSIRCLGSSALNTCYVASGSGDLYYEFGIHIWDMAASSLIAREAGCLIYDPRGPDEKFDLLNRRILVAATPELATQVMKLIDTVIYKPD